MVTGTVVDELEELGDEVVVRVEGDEELLDKRRGQLSKGSDRRKRGTHLLLSVVVVVLLVVEVGVTI